MKITPAFTFALKVDGLDYSFRIEAPNEAEARSLLLAHLRSIIGELERKTEAK